ncbi:MAG TPA: lipoate--protein ligase family protein [Gemmatimonadaceae bacterium]|nr:lipoate--protein ligase family protein [Gemmatimonadaceae bacterium]
MESTTAFLDPAEREGSPPRGVTRYLLSSPADGATNMALDEALLHRAAQTGDVLYRVYAWASPTVSLGRNQPGLGRYDVALARTRGIDFVRRPTGGRAILHHREITYAVAAPVSAYGSLPESYRTINRLLLEALRMVGVDAREAETSNRAPAPSLAPCFASPVAGELVAGGRKLVGSAQVREGDAFLQHGSILLENDQELLTELLVHRERSTPPATVRALLGRSITIQEFAEALASAITTHDGLPPYPMELDAPLLDDVHSLIRTRYALADWTWRR